VYARLCVRECLSCCFCPSPRPRASLSAFSLSLSIYICLSPGRMPAYVRWTTGASQASPTLGAPWGRGCSLPRQSQHGRSCRTSSTLQHHSPGGCPGDCDLQLHCKAGTDGFLAGVTWYTTLRRRIVPPWGTHGPGGVRFPYFFPLDGRSPVSHPECEVPFPPRRSGEYRKGMIPAPGRLWIGLGSRTLERAGR